jgi:DME family drug/metabolite transporter
MSYSAPGSGGPRARSEVAGHPLALPAIALAASLWAAAGVVASRLFDGGVDPLELVGARAAVAALGLGAIPASWRPPRERGRALALVGLGLALALVTASYYLAIERLPVAIGIVLQYTGPLLVVVWAAWFARRTPTPAVLGALAAATVGVGLVTGVAPGHLGGLDGVGVILGFGAAVTFAAYTILSEVVRASYEPLSALFRAFCIAAGFWAVILAAGGVAGDLWAQGVLGPVLFVGVGGTLVPFLLYLWAVPHVRAERASIVATLEPVVAAALAWLWIGQTLTAAQIAGGLLVIGAVGVVQMSAAPSAGG